MLELYNVFAVTSIHYNIPFIDFLAVLVEQSGELTYGGGGDLTIIHNKSEVVCCETNNVGEDYFLIDCVLQN